MRAGSFCSVFWEVGTLRERVEGYMSTVCTLHTVCTLYTVCTLCLYLQLANLSLLKMSISHVREFEDVFTSISEDRDCRVVVLTGAGKNFCSGECVAVSVCVIQSNHLYQPPIPTTYTNHLYQPPIPTS